MASKFICEKCKKINGEPICILDMRADVFCPTDCPGKGEADWRPFEDQEKPDAAADSNQLPKLTAAVFDWDDCPNDAMFAVVDSSGRAYWGSYEAVELSSSGFGWKGRGAGCWKEITSVWDASDWKNSLIRRPEKKTLPDWCKVGNLAYCRIIDRYGKIKKIDGTIHVRHTNGSFVTGTLSHLSEARLRPWTFEEAPEMLKVKDEKGHNSIVWLVNMGGEWSYLVCDCMGGSNRVSFATLGQNYTQLDGSPCGVHEHFDPEREEWVR